MMENLVWIYRASENIEFCIVSGSAVVSQRAPSETQHKARATLAINTSETVTVDTSFTAIN